MDKSIACCLVIRNSEKYLNTIFYNLDKLREYFLTFNVICVYDNCDDNTETMLYDYKNRSLYNVYLINNHYNTSSFKTVRLANARNKYLYVINNLIKNVDYHFVIDSNNINCFKWNYNLFLKYLNRQDWDCISFNRTKYYDIWEVFFDIYIYNQCDFGENSIKIINHIKDKFLNIINCMEENQLFDCLSVFNGFSIYRTSKFIDCYYDGYQKNLNEFITNERINLMIETLKNELNDNNIERKNTKIEISEHIYYHLTAIKKHNARICISKEYIDK
jgi:hypothetical protein